MAVSLVKQSEYFDPMEDLKAPIHIIGCGAIGSTLALMLTRMGVTKLHIYDFDKVEMRNVCNQEFDYFDIGNTKIEALNEKILKLNPDKEDAPILHEKWTPGDNLRGYIFLCVDNIDIRRSIVEENQYNPQIKAIFDFRMRLADAQHYAARYENLEYLLKTMQFSHDEAKAETPVSACGTELNVITTVRTICSMGLSNFINLVRKNTLKKCILIDNENMFFDTFDE